MNNSNLLDDLEINPNADYSKHLKHIWRYLLGGILLFCSACSIPWIFPAEQDFERALLLPKGFAVPVLIAILGIALLMILFSLFKMLKYLLAKRKFNKNNG